MLLLYVPTNRRATATLSSIRDELEMAGRGACVAVIEHGLDPSASAHHASLLGDVGAAFAVHLTEGSKRSWIDRVLGASSIDSRDRAAARRMLLPVGIAYSAGPNIAYLLAAAVGAASVHRRDSDVELPAGRLPALVQELSGLRGISGPAVVGTGTFGDPTFDRRSLFRAGDDHAVAFQALGRPGRPLADVRAEAIDYLVKEPNRVYSEEFIRPDHAWQVEMEVCAIQEAFRWVPEVPALGTLGCDYMVKDVVFRSLGPILFHSAKWRHKYDMSRAFRESEGASVAYHLSDVRYLQFGRIWQEHWTRFPRGSWAKTGFDAEAFADEFSKLARQVGDQLEEVRRGAVAVYRAAALAGPNSSGSAALAKAATVMERNGDRFNDTVRDACDDFAYLTQLWPALQNGAASVGPPSPVRTVA